MNNSETIDSTILDLVSRYTGFGGANSHTYSVFRGLNVMGGIPALPHNVDNQGMVFFTKPCMNLTYDNVSNIRKLAYLSERLPYGMGNAIRCMFNPVGSQYGDNGSTGRSKIIDDKCAFLPLSNLLLNLSAPPDLAADTYVSNEGWAHEQVGWIDGVPGINNSYDLTATFSNLEGDPISNIFSMWIEYGQRVSTGSMLPFPINMVENRIDYQTRIYRITLDRSRKFVQNIYACGAAFPYTAPIGAKHGYAHDQHLNQENNQVQISFKCFGAIYDDPILLHEFNLTVGRFNPNLETDLNSQLVRPNTVKKVDGIIAGNLNMKALMNYQLYPLINIATMELEWYADKEKYDMIMGLVESAFKLDKDNKSTLKTQSQILSPWSSPEGILEPHN